MVMSEGAETWTLPWSNCNGRKIDRLNPVRKQGSLDSKDIPPKKKLAHWFQLRKGVGIYINRSALSLNHNECMY